MNKIKPSIAVVGGGYWGKNLVRNFYELGALNTVCDSDGAVVQKFVSRYEDIKGTVSYPNVLSDPAVKGVALATPAAMHADMARKALVAGKDVFVEKPLCLSEKEGIELNELAQKHNKILMVGHLLWYHPAIIKLKELIDAGRLGALRYVYSNRLNFGKLRKEENVLWSFAPHDISVILGLIKEFPESVYTMAGEYINKKIADTTVTLLNFAGGVKAHIFVSWLHPFKEQKLVVVGEKMMAVFKDTAPWREKLLLYPYAVEWDGDSPSARKVESCPVEIEEKEPLKEECFHFLRCIDERKTPRTDGKEGLSVMRVLNGCRSSMETKREISFDMKNSKNVRLSYFAHETSVIDENVKIGAGTKIWHFSHLISGSAIGKNCNIGQNVVIGPDVVIGNGCKIQNNVSVYPGVTLKDNVFCGPSMVFTNVYNPRSAIPRKNEIRETLVKKGATLGANSTVVCGVLIGRFAFIGAGAVVTCDVPDYALFAGNPAKIKGWMCECGIKLDFNENAAVCAACGMRYELEEESKTPVETQNIASLQYFV